MYFICTRKLFYDFFFLDDEEPDKKTMAQLLKQSLGIEDVSS